MTFTVDPLFEPLCDWGFDDHFCQLYRETAAPTELPGRVLRADRGGCVVALPSGEVHLPVAGRLLAPGGSPPTTGDFVVVSTGEVTAVLERRSAVVRVAPDPGRALQVLAANVDVVFVVEALGERWRPRRLERLLVVAWESGARPVVVLTKADRCAELDKALADAAALAPAVKLHAVSVPGGYGVEAVAAELAPRSTGVMLGRSGTGKSTLANALSGGAAGLLTGAARSDGKGRHTTVARELVRLVGGALLIDTPGVRAIGLVAGDEGIEGAFAEVETLAAACRFRDCAHDREPGCAVQEAVATGELDRSRLESYRRLLREQARLEARADPRLQAKRAAEGRRWAKEARSLPRR